jgi:deoxyadenosine/deoxycytidine kinase
MSTAPAIFTIDANIGAGKTTILNYLHTHYHIPIDPEPVEKWEPYLQELYKSDKGAFPFQVRVWLDRCWIQQRANMSPILMERSPYFQKNVFIPVNVDNSKFTNTEHTMLLEMYNRSMAMWSPKGYVYLRSDPEKCLQRIAKRGRSSENTIPVDYLRALHKYHEISYMNGIASGMQIIVIDVEGKTVETIAYEVYKALQHLGMIHYR